MENTRVNKNINFCVKSDPTSYASSSKDDLAFSAFMKIIYMLMLGVMVLCTNSEAERCKDNFKITKDYLMIFIAVLNCKGIFSSGEAVRNFELRKKYVL